MPGRDTEDSLARTLVRLVDGLAALASDHASLARVELAREIDRVSREWAWLLAAVALLSAGYVLVCAGIGGYLGRLLGREPALLVEGGASLLCGAFLLARAVKNIGRGRPGRDPLPIARADASSTFEQGRVAVESARRQGGEMGR